MGKTLLPWGEGGCCGGLSLPSSAHPLPLSWVGDCRRQLRPQDHSRLRTTLGK